jgi:hypothetical protein
LWLFCAAYVLPGLFGREPWKGNEFNAFSYMLAIAENRTGWFTPEIWGVAPKFEALLPYWLGAVSIKVCASVFPLDLAVRIPFALFLGLTLWGTWTGAYYLALHPRAQPVQFAFGGEASPKDYAHAIADGSLLALIATLGLTLMSHEASPILAQLGFLSLIFLGAAAIAHKPAKGLKSLFVGSVGLGLSGAPSLAIFLSLGSALLIQTQKIQLPNKHRYVQLVLATALTTALFSNWLNLWKWRIIFTPSLWNEQLSLLTWFLWPTWPFAIWALWQWRRQWLTTHWSPHLIFPIFFAGLVIIAAVLMPNSDQTLLLALPPLSILAAFALPTMRRTITSLVDWFTLIFFSGCAFVIWVIWFAMQTGWPSDPATNVAKLAPEFVARFEMLNFIAALAGTIAWTGLVAWRTSKHRHPLWKSMVLPASGAALCWLLFTTLWLPLLDHARNYEKFGKTIAEKLQNDHPNQHTSACIYGLDLDVEQLTAIHYYGKRAVYLYTHPNKHECEFLVTSTASRAQHQLADWTYVTEVHRPTDKSESVSLYRLSSPLNEQQREK